MKKPMGFVLETEVEGGDVKEDFIKEDMIFDPQNNNSEPRSSIKVRIGEKEEKLIKHNHKLNVYKFKKMKASRDNWRCACIVAIFIIVVLVSKIYRSGYMYDVFGYDHVQTVQEDDSEH